MPNILITSLYERETCVLGTVSFDEHDASIYLRPISRRTAMYDYGCHTIPAGV